MRVLSKRSLREFWLRHPQAERAMAAWYDYVDAARWENFADLKRTFNSADLVADKVVFNIRGNEYRIIAYVVYGPYYRVLIKFVGTHQEYDRIDPRKM